MNNYDLSILIPARNEEFVKNTVEALLENKRGRTEIIVGLDGQWANPQIPDHKDVTIFYSPVSLGQRGMTNQLARLSSAKYVMKLDAHCWVSEGFDAKLMKDMQDNWTVTPMMLNLHGFDWVCEKGHRRYQSPSGNCKECGLLTKKDIIFRPKSNTPHSSSFIFDRTMHFQYFNNYKKIQQESGSNIVETLSFQGSCFMLTREKYWSLNICDEKHGSWGQQGVEVALKTWLSGGRLVCNKDVEYAHLFRTQGGDFSFPYPISGRDQEKAREYSRDLWLNNKWDQQIHSVRWLLEKFNAQVEFPKDYWTKEEVEKLPYLPSERQTAVSDKGSSLTLDNIQKAYEEINKLEADEDAIKSAYERGELNHLIPEKNIIFYTDNKLKIKIASAVQKQLRSIQIPIISSSLKDMSHFGTNVVIPYPRGLEAYFNQIIAALETSTADIAYMCEHDVLYHPSHFDFIPPRKDMFYYNQNVWRIRPQVDNLAITWDANQVAELVGYREYILDWYKRKWNKIQEEGFDRSYEPGGRDASQYEIFRSEYPNIDIRHGANLTKSKWSINDFRDKSTAKNLQISTIENIPGWDSKLLLSLR